MTPTDLDFSQAFTERTPRIVQAAKLHRSAARRKAHTFLVEGENSVEAAVTTGAATDVYVTEKAAQRFGEIIQSASYLDVYVHPITDGAASSLADTVTSTGIFALCKDVVWSMGKAFGRHPKLVALPVATSEPGNAGTLIRVSDAVGADAVIFAGETVDPQSSKVVRSSAGSLFHLPVARHPDIGAVVREAQAKGLQILATAANGDVDLDDADELLEKPSAWLFGNEAHGLDEEIQNLADHRVSIPMRGSAESLNLGTAAAICLYQSARAQSRAQSRTEQRADPEGGSPQQEL